MSFCTACGSPIAEVEAEGDTTIVEAPDTEVPALADVEIAKIQADRDIKLAKIQKGIAADEAVQGAEVATAEAAAVVDVLTPPPAPEPTPVEVVDPDPEPEGEPEDAIPDAGTPPEPQRAGNPWFK
jgi:hypothetical protein